MSSTDKNLMVPVGGAIVMSPAKESIKHLSQLYPGRASASPMIDLMITLLNMGEIGLKKLLH